jgi:hypothetical protein
MKAFSGCKKFFPFCILIFSQILYLTAYTNNSFAERKISSASENTRGITLSSSNLFTIENKFYCGLVSDKWIPGKLIKTRFLSYAAERSDVLRKIKKDRRNRGLQRRSSTLRKLQRERTPLCQSTADVLKEGQGVGVLPLITPSSTASPTIILSATSTPAGAPQSSITTTSTPLPLLTQTLQQGTPSQNPSPLIQGTASPSITSSPIPSSPQQITPSPSQPGTPTAQIPTTSQLPLATPSLTAVQNPTVSSSSQPTATQAPSLSPPPSPSSSPSPSPSPSPQPPLVYDFNCHTTLELALAYRQDGTIEKNSLAQLNFMQLYAPNNIYLGLVNFDIQNPAMDSIDNVNGLHGSTSGSASIFNSNTSFGSPTGSNSPWNPNLQNPPRIRAGFDCAYLTTNKNLAPRVDPYEFAEAIGRLQDAP